MHINDEGQVADRSYFPFLQLPGELRNKIYKLLLINTNKVKDSAYTRSYTASYTKLSICPTILRVSRQINIEATPYLYSLNRFQAHPSLLRRLPFLADPWRPVISSSYCSMITRIYIAVRLDCDQFWTPEDLAKAFSGIEHLGKIKSILGGVL
jgi:hypothetical protein